MVNFELIEGIKDAIADAKRAIARAKKEVNSPATDALIDSVESLTVAVNWIAQQLALLDDSG